MTTLKNILVIPQFAGAQIIGATITRYLDTDGYRKTASCQVTTLPVATQKAFGAVVAHAQKLRDDDERIGQVFGEMLASVADQTHTETLEVADPETGEKRQQVETVVDSYRPQISLALTLVKLDGTGERTTPVTTEQLTEPARAAVLELWRLLTEE